jgi:hypothetical protein
VSNAILWFVDGQQRSSYGAGQWPSQFSDLRIGASNQFGYWRGQIDEVRVSSVARYTGNFVTTRTPFSPDAQTIALYHLDETSTNGLVADASGNGHSGRFMAGTSGLPQPVTEICH